MKILLTGNRGMVGTELVKELEKEHCLLTPRRHELNVSNFDQVMSFKKEKLDLIIHLASETDHEYCEENPAQCYFVNTIGTAFMTRLANDLQIPIIYQSTASVFDGSKQEPYGPQDSPNPTNHYNKSKYYGELIVQRYEKHIVLRTGWMFGGGPGIDKKFVAKIISKIERGDKEIKVCTDCIGSPTYSKDLAESYKYVIKNLLFGGDWGTYNCVNKAERGVSRYEFAFEVLKILGDDVDLVPCLIDDLKQEFPCKRTNYEVLAEGIGMRDWREALKEYLHANYRR